MNELQLKLRILKLKELRKSIKPYNKFSLFVKEDNKKKYQTREYGKD